MILDKEKLPDDSELLKQLLFEMQIKHEEEYAKQNLKYQLLKEKYETLKDKFFKKSSEKLSKYEQEQMLLFNEAETESEETEEELRTETATVKTYTRKKRGRKKLPADLPREEIIYDLSAEEKECPCCGKERPNIGKKETEELDIIPAKIKVIKHVKLKYGPCKCDDFLEEEIPEVKTAKMPARLIPGSIVSPGLLAYSITFKFVDSLPFYRQSKIFERIDVEISRATLCNWSILAAEKCEVLIELMRKEIRSGPLIQMDETTVQVLKEEGRDPTTKSYMWLTIGYPEYDKPIILFDYHASRSKDIPVQKLQNYTGYLQTDGYSGYNEAGNKKDITHVGCFAHARRKFVEAAKLSKKKVNTGGKGLKFIQEIYKIEKTLREQNLSDEEFLILRKKEAMPVLDKFYTWLLSVSVPPESKAGKAVSYTLKEWNKLVKYLEIP
jgi:transposase